MDSSEIGIFLHVVGGIGLCVALGIEWTGLWQLRNVSQPVQVRTAMGMIKSAMKLGFISMLITVLVGLYMIWIEWGFVAWIVVSLVALFVVIMLNAAITRPRLVSAGQTFAKDKGVITEAFHNQSNHPLLWISIQSRAALVLGITFIMIAKPDLAISLVTIAISAIVGLAAAIPFLRHARLQEQMVH